MKALLDTHVFLWVILDDRRLSLAARTLVSNRENQLLLSSVSVWEIVTKWRLGKLVLRGDPAQLIPEQMSRLGIDALPLTLDTPSRAPPYRLSIDPWDRLLVAQALVESAPIATADAAFQGYAVELVW